MKQPSASVTGLGGSGHILPPASKPWVGSCHRRLGSSSATHHVSAVGCRNCILAGHPPVASGLDRPQANAFWDFAGCDHSPQGDKKLAGQGDNHDRLAHAFHTVGPCAIPLCECTIFLKQEEPPGELDQTTA